MVNALLEQAFDEVAKLPDDEQESFARLLQIIGGALSHEERLQLWRLIRDHPHAILAMTTETESETRWDRQFQQSPTTLETLAQEALDEHRRGETQEMDLDRDFAHDEEL